MKHEKHFWTDTELEFDEPGGGTPPTETKIAETLTLRKLRKLKKSEAVVLIVNTDKYAFDSYKELIFLENGFSEPNISHATDYDSAMKQIQANMPDIIMTQNELHSGDDKKGTDLVKAILEFCKINNLTPPIIIGHSAYGEITFQDSGVSISVDVMDLTKDPLKILEQAGKNVGVVFED